MPLTESRKKWIDPVKGFVFLSDEEIAKLTKQELYDYRESQKNYWDMYSVLETAENKGFAEGLAMARAEIQAGIAKGERLKAISVATSLLSMEMPVDKIAQATGLTIDEIKSINV